MLVQLPRGSSDQSPKSAVDECGAFEAALRRDLASAPVISYDSVLGGWSKRALDLTLTLFSAPVWGPALLGAALWSKLKHPAPVFVAQPRVGYGGRQFRCLSLRVAPPTAVIEVLRPEDTPAPANDDWNEIAGKAEDRRAKWLRALERLPRLINVLRGEMSLVGPSPLSQDEIEGVNTGRRYYLSARPGVIGVSAVADADEEEAVQYKMYALSWSLMTDAMILWDALTSLQRRGELWKPGPTRKPDRAAREAADRRRSRSA